MFQFYAPEILLPFLPQISCYYVDANKEMMKHGKELLLCVDAQHMFVAINYLPVIILFLCSRSQRNELSNQVFVHFHVWYIKAS